MKTTLTLCLFSLISFGQNINFWYMNPDTACPGDVITVYYRLTPDPPAQNATSQWFIGGQQVWAGSTSTLVSAHVPYGGSQWTYSYNLTVPSLPQGTVQVTGTGTGFNPAVQTLYVKNCSCTITANFTYSANYQQVTFTSTSTGTTPATVYNWDFGVGAGYIAGSATQTYSYYLPGTYTVSLNTTNPTCSDTKTMVVTVVANSTGINEYSQNPQNLEIKYFDFQGNRVEKRPGLLIEQRGTARRKILISTE